MRRFVIQEERDRVRRKHTQDAQKMFRATTFREWQWSVPTGFTLAASRKCVWRAYGDYVVQLMQQNDGRLHYRVLRHGETRELEIATGYEKDWTKLRARLSRWVDVEDLR